MQAVYVVSLQSRLSIEYSLLESYIKSSFPRKEIDLVWHCSLLEMSSIGPQIPAHLLGQFKRVSHEQEDDESDGGAGPKPPKSSIGPQIPDHFQTSTRAGESEVRVYDDSEDDTGPRPSLDTLRRRVVEVERERGSRPFVGAEQGKANLPRVLGPSLPGRGVTVAHDSDDDDDDDIGPKPFVGSQHSQPDAIKDFMEKEEKRRKAAEVCTFDSIGYFDLIASF